MALMNKKMAGGHGIFPQMRPLVLEKKLGKETSGPFVLLSSPPALISVVNDILRLGCHTPAPPH